MSTGVMLFNPFTGKPRDPRDIASDPHGLLVWDGEEPLRPAALATQRQDEPVASAVDEVTDAQRYRWIRKNSNFMHCNIEIYGNGFEISDTLDEAIDAAMQKDTQ